MSLMLLRWLTLGRFTTFFGDLSKSAPLGLAHSTFGPHDIHLGKIFATFGLVCEACYVYHPNSELWLVPMRRILGLMFDVTMPFL